MSLRFCLIPSHDVQVRGYGTNAENPHISNRYQKLNQLYDQLEGGHRARMFSLPHVQVPGFCGTPVTIPRSRYRLEVFKAGFVDVSPPGARPLAERAELLKAYRARWECLRWTDVVRLPPIVPRIYSFAGDTLAYISSSNPFALRLCGWVLRWS